jgi:THUMP domain-like/RNA cap guanine-N2 methyltransferase
MAEAGVQRFEALLTPPGRELLDHLAAEAMPADTMPAGTVPAGTLRAGTVPAASALRLGTELRAHYPADLVAAALAQHELRLQARAKFSRAMEMFFTRPGLEQASAEVVARHRSGRYGAAAQVADLCCGIGGDLVVLAADRRVLAAGRQVLAVDRDPLHLRIAQVNAGVYGAADRVTLMHSDVRDVDLAGVDAVFVDPARRAGGRRLRTGQSEPPLDWCFGLAGSIGAVGIKAAPGLPHQAVPPGWELEFIAVGRALKEAVAWSPALATGATRATILPQGHVLLPQEHALPQKHVLPHESMLSQRHMSPPGHTLPPQPGTLPPQPGTLPPQAYTLVPEPGPPVDVRLPGEFLLDPNPAVTRASLVQELARSLGAWQIDEQIAFLSADVPLRSPFGRALRVLDSAPWHQKQLPARLRQLDIGAVDIRRRGLAGDVDLLHRRLRLSGSRRATLVMTRVQDRPWALICLDLDQPGAI